MLRPCTIWGSGPFDATDFCMFTYGHKWRRNKPSPLAGEDCFLRYADDNYFFLELVDKNEMAVVTSRIVHGHTDLAKMKLEVYYHIHQALNAPVLVTEDVIKGIPPNSSFYISRNDPDNIFIRQKHIDRYEDYFSLYPCPTYLESCDLEADNIWNEFKTSKEGYKIIPTNYIAQQYLIGFTTEGKPHESVY